MFESSKTIVFFVLSSLLLLRPSMSDEPASDKPASISTPPANRWLLLCCGLAGDEQHHERLTAACKKIVTHCGPVLGITPERCRVLAGDEPMAAAIRESGAKVGLCSQENIQLGIEWLAKNATQEDETWIVFLGHSNLYGNRSQYNIPGRDIDQIQFAEMTRELKQRRQVFVFTMPVTGFWAKPLAKPNRIVITATEPALEFTGTEMPYAIADVLAGEGEHQKLEDIDKDNAVTLLDLYLAVNLEIEGRFRAMERLQTEHAQLDDNGDGKGSEVQSAYLPIISKKDKSVTKPSLPSPIVAESLDGFLSRTVLLRTN